MDNVRPCFTLNYFLYYNMLRKYLFIHVEIVSIITLPIGASIDKTRSKLEKTKQIEVSQFIQYNQSTNYFYYTIPTVTRSGYPFDR